MLLEVKVGLLQPSVFWLLVPIRAYYVGNLRPINCPMLLGVFCTHCSILLDIHLPIYHQIRAMSSNMVLLWKTHNNGVQMMV